MSIALSDMKDKLLTLSQWEQIIAPTENMSTINLAMDGTEGFIAFSLPSGWNVGLEAMDPTDLTEAFVGVGGKEYRFSKASILAVAHAVGLSPKYVAKTPGPMIQSHLNYWASHSPDLALRFLVQNDEVIALTKQGITPFSNLELTERVVEKVCERYGLEDDDLYVDYKSSHSLEQTNLRLIIPQEARVLSSKRSDSDEWCGGVQLRNSLIGAIPLSVQGYLFSWFCTNGAVTYHSEGKFNRKIMGQDIFEVGDWVGNASLQVLENLDHDFDTVEGLIEEDISGDLSAVLADIFKTYRVPMKARGLILDEVLDGSDTSYYGVMNAVTQAANTEGLAPHFVTALMEIGGDIAANAHDRCQSCQRVMQ